MVQLGLDWHHGHTDVLPPLGDCREDHFFCNTGVKASRPVDSCDCRNDMYRSKVGQKSPKMGNESNPTFNLGNPCNGYINQY